MRHPSVARPGLMTALLLVACLLAPSPALAQDQSPTASAGTFCALLAADEVRAALSSGAVTMDGGDSDCTYQSGAIEFDTSIEAGAISDLGGPIAGYTDITVAGQPGALYSDGTELYVQTDKGLLVLDVYGDLPTGTDPATALESLATTALGRVATITVPTPEPPPTPGPFCAVLSLAEVSAAIGIDAKVGDSFDGDCLYEDSGKSFTALEVSLDTATLAETQQDYPDGVDVTVGGQPGLRSADGTYLFVQTAQGMLMLHLIVDDGQPHAEAATILAALGPIVVSRLPSIPVPSQSVP
jgi:hypothetical protein